jgi:hyperosmotically inducible protein
MHSLRSPIFTSAALALLSCSCAVLPVQALTFHNFAQTAPDNSKQNQNQKPTADNQSNATADRQTTANIRKAIIADKNLSTYAHNVKIITSNGAVTLKGPVKSEDEKQQIATDAASVVSADKITNDLTVKQ